MLPHFIYLSLLFEPLAFCSRIREHICTKHRCVYSCLDASGPVQLFDFLARTYALRIMANLPSCCCQSDDEEDSHAEQELHMLGDPSAMPHHDEGLPMKDYERWAVGRVV
eukprot:scpid113129/ scgid1155/ 